MIRTAADSGYLHGLDGLRAFAAMSVVFVHISDHLPIGGTLARVIDLITLDGIGSVNLFFTLSGFLITLLLLRERDRAGSVDVKRFTFRRARRILPLYFVTLIVGLPVVTLIGGEVLTAAQIGALALVVTSNLIYPDGGALVVLWSIGIEEQFYLVWSRIARRRLIAAAALAVILARLIVDPVISAQTAETVLSVWRTMRYEVIAVGALAAILYTRYPVVLTALTRRPMRVLAFGAFGGLVMLTPKYSAAINLAQALLFALVMFNVMSAPGVLEARALRWVGIRSYSLYMTHYLVITLLIAAGVSGAALALIVPPLALAIAAVSYQHLERRFLPKRS